MYFYCSCTDPFKSCVRHFFCNFLKVCKAINHEQIELESCSNPLRIQKVLNCSSKTFYPFRFWVVWRWRHNEGMFSNLANLPGPERQPYEVYFWLKLFFKLGQIRVFRAIDWLYSIAGSRIMAQKSCFWQKSKSFTKGRIFHFRANFGQP